MKIFTINPGSTSTKIALIFVDDAHLENLKVLFSVNVAHEARILAQFSDLKEQLPYRRETLMKGIDENKLNLEEGDAFVGRGGGLIAMEGGTYHATELMAEHALNGANGVLHPANLGSVLSYWLSGIYHRPAFVVNPPDVDELQDLARMTGIKGVNRIIHLHALNLKETAIRHANSHGETYENENYIVCHIGGGISISAHRCGKMVDGYDISGGEGPMAPTRCGSISVADLADYIRDKDWKTVRDLCTKTGGMVSHLGTSDAQEVYQRGMEGDSYAKTVWDSMIYQIEKGIGSMAAVLHGKVKAVLLGGGMVHNKSLVEDIKQACSFIAPVFAYPGEFEMEAMASGAARVLCGMEEAKIYTGIPVWAGFGEQEES